MATKLRDPATPDYDADGVGRAEAQAAALLARRVDLLDWENLADEIADSARHERDKLQSALGLVLAHLLKWDHQPARRSRSWWLTIAEQRDGAAQQLAENPSLRPRLPDTIDTAYRSARREAAVEIDRPLKELPIDCPYGFDEIMTRPIEWDGELA